MSEQDAATTENLRAETELADINTLIAAEQLRDLRDNRDERETALRMKARADRMRELLIGAGVLLVIAMVISFTAMVISATQSRAVIVESFDAPEMPAPFVASGVTGKTIAADVLDGFTRVQGAVRSAVTKRNLGNAWTREIEIEVPKTGLSIGQINRLLKSWLGHDTHISGSLVQTGPGRVALTVRGTSIPARRFEGSAAELPALSTRAAEYLFGEAEPALMGVYLTQQGRFGDVDKFVAANIARVDDTQRVRMLGDWSSALDVLGRHAEAIDKLRAAVRIDPYAFARRDHLVILLYPVAGPEVAVAQAKLVVADWDAAPASRRAPEIDIQNSLILLNELQRVSRATLEDSARTLGGSSLNDNRTHLLENAAMLHDYGTAQRLLAQLDLPSREMRAAILSLSADRRADLDQPAQAIPLYERARALSADPAKRNIYTEKLATALVAAGRGAEAQSLIAALPADADFYVKLIRLRAFVGDARSGEAAYRALIAGAPLVSDGWVEWGRARLDWHDYRGAERAFLRATMLAPNWADAWEGCGRARVAQGQWAGAVDCYAKALEGAPAWPGLAARLARAQAKAVR